jgi:glycosyltransferase involved in cell wall biosynthesis
MMPRHLLFISQDLGIGGLERVVATLARTVDRTQFTPRALCLRELGEFGQQLRDEGIPVDVLPWHPDRPDYLSFVEVARLIRDANVAVVHSHNTDAFLNAGLARLLVPRRLRLVHTDHARAFPDRAHLMIAESLLARMAHMVVGVSAHTTAQLARYEKIPASRLCTIPNGIDGAPFDHPADRRDLRARLGVPAEAELVGLGARLTRQKGVDVLLEAWPAVCARHPGAHLVIVGDGPERDALEAQAGTLGVSERVTFAGARVDFVELLPALDVYVFASRWEGLPMALLEAMAARRAIVATAVGGMADVLRDDEHALLVPPEAAPALADAITRLLGDETRRARLAETGRALFDREYSAATMTRRYERLYRGERL